MDRDDPSFNELTWCHGCGDWVEALGADDLCPICEELDARLDAHIGAAMEDYAERAVSIALDYLHPDDVLVVLERIVEDRGGVRDEIPRLRDRYERSHRYIDERARRARERKDEMARRARERAEEERAEELEDEHPDE